MSKSYLIIRVIAILIWAISVIIIYSLKVVIWPFKVAYKRKNAPITKIYTEQIKVH